MNVSCSTCLELISPSDDLSVAPCGHAFHSPCIAKWLQTGRANCPQCRKRCTAAQLRRLFLTESADVSASQAEDPARMQGRVDSLTFQVRCLEKEKKAAAEKAEEEGAKNAALREEFREAERQRQSIKNKFNEAKAQISFLKNERVQVKEAQDEAKDLRDKLKLYQTIDAMVKGSNADVNNRLHDVGDFSQASRELSIIIVALKRELTSTTEDNRRLNGETSVLMQKNMKLRRCMEEDSRRNAHLLEEAKSLRAEVRDLIRDKEALLERLEAAASPKVGRNVPTRLDEEEEDLFGEVDDPPTPAVAASSLATSPLGKKEEDAEEKAPSLYKSKSCFLPSSSSSTSSSSACKRPRRDPCTNATNHPVLSQFNIMKKKSLKLSSQSGAAKNISSDLHYDGMGGHSKPDVFPTPTSRISPRKKAVRPNAASSVASGKKRVAAKDSAKLNTINKYFNFDTP